MRGSAIDDSMLLTVICELLNKFDIFCLFSGWETVSREGGFFFRLTISAVFNRVVRRRWRSALLTQIESLLFPKYWKRKKKLFFSLQILPRWN